MMIPGRTTRLTESRMPAASRIAPKTDIVLIDGTATIDYIVPNFGGNDFCGMLILIPVSGTGFLISTQGNILGGASIALHRPAVLVYVKSAGLWVVTNIPDAYAPLIP